VTTTVIAVLFAIGLSLAGSANRPRQVTLDDLPVYWMDSKSPMASETIGLSVSSPERQSLAVSVGDGAILTAGSPANARGSDVDIATEITHERRLQPGWDVRLGPPVQVELSLLRWSFTDLDFQTLHTFPGTVMMSHNLHLKNETGQLFREAMYLDFPENKKYLIFELSPGQEVDLTAVPPAPIYVRIRREAGEFTVESNEEPPGAPHRLKQRRT